jgi:hypothetical protein
MQLVSFLLGLAATAQAALPTIETYGNKFYDATGKQFFMKGTYAWLGLLSLRCMGRPC